MRLARCDRALDENTSTLITMLRTSLAILSLAPSGISLLASAGAFYARNIGRVLRGPDSGVADRHWPITIFCQCNARIGRVARGRLPSRVRREAESAGREE